MLFITFIFTAILTSVIDWLVAYLLDKLFRKK